MPCIGRKQLDVLDVLEGQVHTISLPINVKAVFLVAEDRWLLVESKTDRCLLSSSLKKTESDYSLFMNNEHGIT